MNKQTEVKKPDIVILSKDNSLASYIEVKRFEREKKIKARHNRTARYREKVNSLVKA